MLTSAKSIKDRLADARRKLIVGREAEFSDFRTLVESDQLPYCVLNYFGPGGVGKTTMAHTFIEFCRQKQIPVSYLDLRNVGATPDEFLKGLEFANVGDLPFTREESDLRQVLILDTYEKADALDGYLRDVLLPTLSSETIVVILGRYPLSAQWQDDPGWKPLLRTVALRNLAPEDSRRYLVQRDVPEISHQEALDFTHGHPLALSLIADVLTRPGQSGTTVASSTARCLLENEPDIVNTLLKRFIEETPSEKHRAALEVIALVRYVDEALLQEMLEETPLPESGEIPEKPSAAIRTIFEWLRGLSFVEASVQGLFPHDIVREALITDLRWRNRDRYVELHHRARDYYAQRMKNATGQNQQRLLYDAIFLHRDSAVVQAAFTWHESPTAYPDNLRPGDGPSIRAMIERYEGEESACLAEKWLERQPEAAVVFRDLADPSSGPVGFFILLTLPHDSDPDQEPDPAVRAALNYLRQKAPLRDGEVARHLRFWMARDSYQNPSPVQSLLIVHALRQFLLKSSLAFTFFAASDPDLWAPVFEYVEIASLPEAAFHIGGHDFGVYGQDWRLLPANAWLARLFDREVSAGALTGGEPASPEVPLLVLSEPEFAASVRDALKRYMEPEKMASNPLLQSRLVIQRAGEGADTTARIKSLRALILQSAEVLKGSPRSERGFKALYRTYIKPAPTQEQAAVQLDLPFATYRRHLGEGVLAVTRRLWQMETGTEK